MPRTRPPYPPEFRREAICLVRASDEEHPIRKIAKKLGVTAETLRNWVKHLESGKPEDTVTWPSGPLSPSLQDQAHLNKPPNVS